MEDNGGDHQIPPSTPPASTDNHQLQAPTNVVMSEAAVSTMVARMVQDFLASSTTTSAGTSQQVPPTGSIRSDHNSVASHANPLKNPPGAGRTRDVLTSGAIDRVSRGDTAGGSGVRLPRRRHDEHVISSSSSGEEYSDEEELQQAAAERASSTVSRYLDTLCAPAAAGGGEDGAGNADPPPAAAPDAVLQQLADDFGQTDTVGPDINSLLAGMFTKLVLSKLPDAKATELLRTFVRPNNCECPVPKIEHNIWNDLPAYARTTDFMLQQIQAKLAAVLLGGVAIVDTIHTDTSKSGCPYTRQLMNASSLQSCVYHDISQLRRELIKPHLKPQFKLLCSVESPDPAFLFGVDTNKRIKELRETSNITQSIFKRKSGNNFNKPNSSFGGKRGSGNKKPFLGKHRGGHQSKEPPPKGQKYNKGSRNYRDQR